MSEEWRPIVGYEGLYEVSNIGRVRSLVVFQYGKKTRRVHVMAQGRNAGGYPRVSLRREGRRRGPYSAIHRMVLAAFVGPCPDGMEACHLNGDKTDNRVENLKWATHRENVAHQRAHGTMQLGDRCHFSTLTEREVRAIKRLFECGVGRLDMGRAFGVTADAIEAIESGSTWAHLDAGNGNGTGEGAT